jgi:regulator of sigma E protease
MDIIIMIFQFIAGMSLLVVLHELGHFLAAKAFGIRVEKFYLFFDAWGISIYKFTYKGTEFGLGWLPFGGYIKMSGLQPEIQEDGEFGFNSENHTYHSKAPWKRFIVMISGILMNMLFAVIIFTTQAAYYGKGYIGQLGAQYGVVPGEIGRQIGLLPGDKIDSVNNQPIEYFQDDLVSSRILRGHTVLTVVRSKGKERIHLHIQVPPDILKLIADRGLTEFINIRTRFKVDSVYSNSDLLKAGLKSNDKITAVNGNPVKFYDDFMVKLQENKARQIVLTVVHDGTINNLLAHLDKDGHIGFSLKADTPRSKVVISSLPQSISLGASKAWASLSGNARGLKEVFNGDIKPSDALTGPVGIASLFGGKLDWKRFWSIVGMLSVALAFINLFPIPLLDGGQSILIGIEAIRGKPLPIKVIQYLQVAGFILMITLTFFVVFNDIRRLIH